MTGYTVTNSISQIDAYCDNPSAYQKWQLKEAVKDAQTHFEHGNVSRSWYDYVVRILSSYI